MRVKELKVLHLAALHHIAPTWARERGLATQELLKRSVPHLSQYNGVVVCITT